MDKLIYLVPVMGAIGLLYTFIKFAWVSKQDAGNERMQEISRYIAEGAMAFLKTLADTIGGRVTGSPQSLAASELILKALKEAEFDDAPIEDYPPPRAGSVGPPPAR